MSAVVRTPETLGGGLCQECRSETSTGISSSGLSTRSVGERTQVTDNQGEWHELEARQWDVSACGAVP